MLQMPCREETRNRHLVVDEYGNDCRPSLEYSLFLATVDPVVLGKPEGLSAKDQFGRMITQHGGDDPGIEYDWCEFDAITTTGATRVRSGNRRLDTS